MHPREWAIVHQFKDRLREEQIPVASLFVYGSRIRGEAAPDSDLNVLVVVKNTDLSIRKQVSQCAWEVGYQSNVFIHSTVMAQDEFESGPERSSLFLRAVVQEGIPV